MNVETVNLIVLEKFSLSLFFSHYVTTAPLSIQAKPTTWTIYWVARTLIYAWLYEFHRLINLILIYPTTFNNVYPPLEWSFIKIDLSVKQKGVGCLVGEPSIPSPLKWVRLRSNYFSESECLAFETVSKSIIPLLYNINFGSCLCFTL